MAAREIEERLRELVWQGKESEGAFERGRTAEHNAANAKIEDLIASIIRDYTALRAVAEAAREHSKIDSFSTNAKLDDALAALDALAAREAGG